MLVDERWQTWSDSLSLTLNSFIMSSNFLQSSYKKVEKADLRMWMNTCHYCIIKSSIITKKKEWPVFKYHYFLMYVLNEAFMIMHLAYGSPYPSPVNTNYLPQYCRQSLEQRYSIYSCLFYFILFFAVNVELILSSQTAYYRVFACSLNSTTATI